MTPVYQFQVFYLGASAGDNLERLTEQVEEFLNLREATRSQLRSYELWQTQVLSDKHGNNGFMLFRKLADRTPP